MTVDDTAPARSEQGLIGWLLLYPAESARWIATLGLRPEHFGTAAARTCWEVIADAAAKGRHLDVVSIEADLRGHEGVFAGGMESWLEQAKEGAQLPEAAAYAVRRYHAARQGIALAAGLHARLRHGVKPSDALGDAQREIAAIMADAGQETATAPGDAVDEFVALYERRAAGDSDTIPTGLDGLDEVIGGWEPERLYIVGARPAFGKSSLALGCARRLALRGMPALYISLEMPRHQCVARLVAQMAHLPLGALRAGSLSAWQRSQMQEASAKLREAPLWIADQTGHIDGILGTVHRWHAQRGQGVVFLDYLQLVEARASRDTREREVAKMSRSLKQLARQIKCPVVCLVQLNREIEREQRPRPPRLADLRESGALEQDADVVMFPHQDPDETDMANGIRRLRTGPAVIVVAKNRDGRTGAARVHWTAETVEFSGSWQPTEHEEHFR